MRRAHFGQGAEHVLPDVFAVAAERVEEVKQLFRALPLRGLARRLRPTEVAGKNGELEPRRVLPQVVFRMHDLALNLALILNTVVLMTTVACVTALLFYRRRDATLLRRTEGPPIKHVSFYIPKKRDAASRAKAYAEAPIDEHIARFAEAEQQAILADDAEFRFHSGVTA